MRVLQLVSRDEPGGVQVLTRMVGEGLSARGYRVDTLALAGVGGSPWRVARSIMRGRYDAILSYQVAAGLVGGLVGALDAVPVRATHLTALPPAMRPHWRWMDKWLGTLGAHTGIIANSSATWHAVWHYPAHYRRRLVSIPHGVRPLLQSTRDLRAELGLPAGTKLIVASGRLVAQKDHATAIAALAKVPEAHLAIAGEGALRSQLLSQGDALGVSGRVHLLGQLEQDDLGALLGQGDVCVMPSTWESFGLAGVEAAMAGVPVVASDLPVLREVLAPGGELARFHAVGDADGLARQVRAVLDAPPATDRRRVLREAMLAAHGVPAMLDLYCRLLDGARRASS